ncbi:MAG: L,D-transpeptidase family protein [Anaerolineales bacterium]|nr:L,D-transpeptidase family protein [Anaerolineales bacterium]
MGSKQLSRRDFLKMAALGLGGMAVRPSSNLAQPLTSLPRVDFPAGERLGRVLGGQTEVKSLPADDSSTVAILQEDDIVVWQRQVVGSRPGWFSQNYIETPQGFVYAPNLQAVRNQPNQPLSALPNEGGVWVEVSVPYVDLILSNPPGRSPWLEHTPHPRLYYSQIMYVDQIKLGEDGRVLYQVIDRYGSYGDKFWAVAEAFRPLTAEEMSPFSPELEDKLVVVRLLQQTLSCYEGSHEVYFCRVSTGGKYDIDGSPVKKWATPVGKHTIWRKLVSLHMTGGTTGGGWDLSGIGWTTLFSGQGMAIHSTFWHNGYGVPRSHGCVNAEPDDAKWVWRWTNPPAPPEPGDVTVSGMTTSTRVQVIEE